MYKKVKKKKKTYLKVKNQIRYRSIFHNYLSKKVIVVIFIYDLITLGTIINYYKNIIFQNLLYGGNKFFPKFYFTWIHDYIYWIWSHRCIHTFTTRFFIRSTVRINVATTIRANDQGLGNKISRLLSVFLSPHHSAPVKKLSLAALSASILPRRRNKFTDNGVTTSSPPPPPPNAFVSIQGIYYRCDIL